MGNPQESYQELASWVDVAEHSAWHPDKAQFDALLSAFVQGVIDRAIEDTRDNANSGTEHIDLIKEYAENKGYEQFFTLD